MHTAYPMIGNRYQPVRELGKGGMGVIYAALDRLTGQMVALKLIATSAVKASLETGQYPEDLKLALSREFQVLASLRHPHIISVLDYGFDSPGEDGQRQPYYTMELLNGSQNILKASENQPLPVKLGLLIELLQALTYLHRRGILHHDLKPENVLRDEQGQIKVLDFGISIDRNQTEGTQETMGTLAYMAPEVLMGRDAAEASDLYAVGVIAYEVLTGRYPFDTSNLSVLVDAIIREEPDLTPLQEFERDSDAASIAEAPTESRLSDAFSTVTGVPPVDTPVPRSSGTGSFEPAPHSLPTIIQRLLLKDPTERYHDAQEVIRDLCAAGNLPLPAESSDIRDSFLQAAQFIGRETEFKSLQDALKMMLTGIGSAWLVAGESGIGKSRLLDELRTHALIQGAWVIRGQAVEGGGLLYELWRTPLRRLVLSTPLDDLEAGILKEVIPDIGVLLERDIPDAPELDSSVARQRLLHTIAAVFKRQTQPLVLLLEDLHWANEDLEILKQLVPLVNEQALLIIGSYRHDEALDLAAQLPTMKLIRLERLAKTEIEALSTSMLGRGGHNPDVVSLLQEETEGNIFFIVEVIRTLAEEVGSLDKVGLETLPVRVFAGGVQQIIRRRLGRVPEDARHLLKLAAIAGRQLDLNMMQCLAGDRLERWLTICADTAVLEIYDGAWRFAHDKLREALLADLIPFETSRLNREVALALEAAYPAADDRELWASVLAEHWHEAGDSQREAEYLELAGKKALESAVYEKAISYFNRALVLKKDATPNQKAALNYALGDAYYNLGHLDQAYTCLILALTLPGYLDGKIPVWRKRDVVVQLLRQLVTWLPTTTRNTNPNTERDSIVMKACERLTLVHYFRNERISTVYYALLGLNIAARTGQSGQIERLRFYSSAALTLSFVAQWRLAKFYIKKVDAELDSIQDKNAITWVMLNTGFYATIIADWVQTEQRLRRCIELSQQIGHVRRGEEAAVTLIGAYYYQGRWQEADELNDALYASSLRSNDLQAQAWALDNQGRFALRTGWLDEAIRIFKISQQIYDQIQDTIGIVWIKGALAKTYLCLGDPETARTYVEQAAVMLAKSPTISFGMLEPFSAVAEYYLTQWEQEPQSTVYPVKAAEALQQLKRYSRNFVIASPRYLAYTGWYQRLAGKIAAARRTGLKAVTEAQRLSLRYDEGIAAFELARHLPADDPRRQAYLNQAEAIFEALGTRWDLDRAHAARG